MRNPSASMLRAAGQSPCTHLVNEPTNPTNTLATSILQTRGNQRAERDWFGRVFRKSLDFWGEIVEIRKDLQRHCVVTRAGPFSRGVWLLRCSAPTLTLPRSTRGGEKRGKEGWNEAR